MGATYGLKFNPEKTVVVIFHKRKINPDRRPEPLIINGKELGFSDSMKYLGVTLDEKLNWNLHFNNTLTACKRALMYTSNIIRKRWGPKPSLSKWLFTGIIRPLPKRVRERNSED